MKTHPIIIDEEFHALVPAELEAIASGFQKPDWARRVRESEAA